ncbi:hypothetical protein KY285_030361 [Solanum tuberosum]|nr:hypothetical protein KY285_030361 [Solanum tuberosum]
MVGGDFNVVLNGEEKIGGLPVQPYEVEDFAFCINSCELEEVPFKSSPFTWWNGRTGEDCIFERLDRMLVNKHLQSIFGHIEVEHLARTCSDHGPMLCTFGVQAGNFIKPLRFLKFWTEHADFMEVVKQNWHAEEGLNPFITFKNKMKKMKGILSKWSREVYGDVFKQLIIREEIVRLKKSLFEEDLTPQNRSILQQCQAELKRYLHYEEEYWRQKAGIDWFVEGDRNTRYFHNLVKGRRNRLKIKRIKDKNDIWLDDENQMATEAVEWYSQQFT